MKPLNNEHLILTDVREAIGSERETGAEVVFTYTHEENDRKTKIYVTGKTHDGPDQWIPDDQKNLPENACELLLANSFAAKDWHEHGIKHVKQYHVIEMA